MRRAGMLRHFHNTNRTTEVIHMSEIKSVFIQREFFFSTTITQCDCRDLTDNCTGIPGTSLSQQNIQHVIVSTVVNQLRSSEDERGKRNKEKKKVLE